MHKFGHKSDALYAAGRKSKKTNHLCKSVFIYSDKIRSRYLTYSFLSKTQPKEIFTLDTNLLKKATTKRAVHIICQNYAHNVLHFVSFYFSLFKQDYSSKN